MASEGQAAYLHNMIQITRKELIMRIANNALTVLATAFILILSLGCAQTKTLGEPPWVIRTDQGAQLSPGYTFKRVDADTVRIIEDASKKRAGSVTCNCQVPAPGSCEVKFESPMLRKRVICDQSLCPGNLECDVIIRWASPWDRFLNFVTFRW